MSLDVKRCCAISDIHGFFDSVNLEKGLDYLFICGDIVPLNIQFYSRETKKWLETFFLPWTDQLGIKEKIILVAGNHDWYFERHPEEVKKLFKDPIVYLENELWEDSNLVIYGTPLCKIFGNWAFMKPPSELRSVFSQVSKDDFDKNKTSILLSHDCAFGAGDIILQKNCPWRTGKHIGNTEIRYLIEKIKPNYHLHGHIHSSNHEAEFIDQTETRCVSLLDENYKVSYRPYYFEI